MNRDRVTLLPACGEKVREARMRGCELRAPHPAFGHPLPASRGEGLRATVFRVGLLPACGEKVREARMRGVTLILVLVFAAACAQEESLVTTDTREPIDFAYVTGMELKVHTKPDDNSPVIATYQSGEGISILEKRGDWIQLRVGEKAGWARSAGLGSAAAAKMQSENPTARFREPAPTVPSVSARGDIYLEADVNVNGEVFAVRVLSNSTGNDELARQNAEALKKAKFFPIVQKGTRKPFKYYHRVSY